MTFMRRATIFIDEKRKRKIVQVDIKEIVRNPDEFEDLIYTLIAEARKNDKKRSWPVAKRQLKKT